MSPHRHSGMFRSWDAVNRRLCSPFVYGDGDLRLPKPVRSAILASKPSACGVMVALQLTRHVGRNSV